MKLGEQRTQTLQKEAKVELRHQKFPWRVNDRHFVDGVAGPRTWKAAGFEAYVMGAPDEIVRAVHEHDLTNNTFEILTHKKPRPQKWERIREGRESHLKDLRKHHRHMVAISKTLDGVVKTKYASGTLYVPAWIEEENEKIHAGGCVFYVVSGFRTPEYSESLCYAMCGSPTCPGRCAGRGTNHACPPNGTCTESLHNGAEDVTNYYEFASTAKRVGSLLKNDLPSDPVHFSYTGH